MPYSTVNLFLFPTLTIKCILLIVSLLLFFCFLADTDRCHPTQPFRCPGDHTVCISIQYLCDGARDCTDGYDEDPRLCTAGNFNSSACKWKTFMVSHTLLTSFALKYTFKYLFKRKTL